MITKESRCQINNQRKSTVYYEFSFKWWVCFLLKPSLAGLVSSIRISKHLLVSHASMLGRKYLLYRSHGRMLLLFSVHAVKIVDQWSSFAVLSFPATYFWSHYSFLSILCENFLDLLICWWGRFICIGVTQCLFSPTGHTKKAIENVQREKDLVKLWEREGKRGKERERETTKMVCAVSGVFGL